MTDVNFGDAGGIITENVTEEVRTTLVGRERNLIAQTIQYANDRLGQFAAANEWDVEEVQAAWNVEVDERGDGLAVRIENEHPAADFFEFGTSPHTINGDPLAFVWEERHDPPEWVRENFKQATSDGGRPGYLVFMEEVNVDGIEETRFLRKALNYLEDQMKAAFGGE